MAVAGAASDELASAVFVKEPGVDDAVAVMEIDGNCVLGAMGVTPLYEHDTNRPVVEQIQSVPVARPGVNDEGNVSLTTTV